MQITRSGSRAAISRYFSQTRRKKASCSASKRLSSLPSAGLLALITAAGALERSLKAGQQQQSEVGPESAADEPIEGQHDLRAELAPAALVGLGGVGEAVGENDLSGFESGPG